MFFSFFTAAVLVFVFSSLVTDDSKGYIIIMQPLPEETAGGQGH